MIEKLVHDLFHAILPLIVEYVGYILLVVSAAVLGWVRSKFQVSAVEIAALREEIAAAREAAVGQKPEGAVKKKRAMDRARAGMSVLTRPRASRLDRLVEELYPR